MQTLLEVEQNLRLKYMAFSAVCLQDIEFNKVLSEMVQLLNFFKRETTDLPAIIPCLLEVVGLYITFCGYCNKMPGFILL